MPKIYLIDVTNRDGVQTARLGLSKLEKTMINIYLNDIGVFQSEFGFPTTRHEINYLKANLELAEIGVITPLRLGGWIRAIPSDVEQTFRNVPNINHLNISISTSEQMIQGKFLGNKSRDDIIKDMNFDGKHSFEDAIVPVEKAYQQWGDRIAIMGGIDVDFLINKPAELIRNRTLGLVELSDQKGGLAIGSGNSIPDYIPIEKYCAMVKAVVEL